jgi:phosphate transport system substrate-binding protein
VKSPVIIWKVINTQHKGRKMNLLKTLTLAAVVSLGITACGEEKKDEKAATAKAAPKKNTTELLGAGATFPYPLYSKMFANYHKSTGVKVNYQSIGSGGGVRQIFGETVDFGASDAFVKDSKLAEAPRKMLHVPIVLGAVAVSYNLNGVSELNLSSEVLADIFLGKITKWNDKAIATDNKGVTLPDQKIVVVHRSDGSGTSAIFTDFLSKVSKEWAEGVGAGKSVKWPAGLGAKGNEGVSGLVKQMPGSIGYMELAYTIQNKMPVVAVKNASGNFVKPALESTSLAAQGTIPEDTRVTLTNCDADQGYPIAGFTWILLYQEQAYKDRSEEKARELVKLLWWMIHDGQKMAEPLHYAKLPAQAVVQAEKILKSVTFNGKPLL